jgi:molybdate transport system ATP-binding protein
VSGIRARFNLAYGGFSLDAVFDFPGRGVTALFGPSGSGKTTCLRVLAGLMRVPGAYVEVNGVVWQDDAAGVFMPTYRRSLGYVFQEASLFAHLNVRDNLEYGMKRIPRHRQRVSLEQVVSLLGIAGLMTRKPNTLSGGERQRVGMARALATSPDILLMDEPLASLDAARKAEILPYLEHLHAQLDIPVLYVSHSIEEVVRLADHLVLLEEGRVTASGAIGDMLTRPDLSLAHGEGAGSLIVATVIDHDDEYQLTCAEFSGGRLFLPQQAVSPGRHIRLRIQARDVSLCLTQQQDISILNSLPAIVTGLDEGQSGRMMVGLDLGGTRLLACIMRKSAVLMALAPGKAVYVQIKGIAILK